MPRIKNEITKEITPKIKILSIDENLVSQMLLVRLTKEPSSKPKRKETFDCGEELSNLESQIKQTKTVLDRWGPSCGNDYLIAINVNTKIILIADTEVTFKIPC
jgi:hypothetical protein